MKANVERIITIALFWSTLYKKHTKGMMFYFEPYRSSNKHALRKFNHKDNIKPNTWRHTWNIYAH